MCEEPHPDVLIRPIREVITVCWIDSPNWTLDTFFEKINREAISSRSKNGYHIIDITRSIWDREVAQLLAEKLAVFEEKMMQKGVNTREEMSDYLDKSLKEVL